MSQNEFAHRNGANAKPTNLPPKGLPLLGVDGCRGGWFALKFDPVKGELESALAPNAAALLHWAQDAVVAIDMPIGLPESGKRSCDVAARGLLGRPRSSSVFPAPVRPALPASDWDDAHARTRAANSRAGLPETGLSRQSFGLLRRIRELDVHMTPVVQRRVFEVHPEVSFRGWNDDQSMRHSKRTADGRAERAALIDERFGADTRQAAILSMRGKAASVDDIHDAFACLWSAERIARGVSVKLPSQAPTDVIGLRMEIRY